MQGLINLSSGSIIGSTSLANSGKNPILSLISSVSVLHSSWILDSGATNHMTPISTMFLNYRACITKQYVQTADGTLLPVVGISSIKFASIGLLIRLLHVPKIFVCRVSVQRIAKSYKHKFIFDGLDVFLCNKVHGRKIRLAKIYNGLQYLLGSS